MNEDDKFHAGMQELMKNDKLYPDAIQAQLATWRELGYEETFMPGYDDPHDEGNSSKYHTGKQCIEKGCTNAAGTWWSPLWCFPCNIKRINSISKQFDNLRQRKTVAPPWPSGIPLPKPPQMPEKRTI